MKYKFFAYNDFPSPTKMNAKRKLRKREIKRERDFQYHIGNYKSMMTHVNIN